MLKRLLLALGVALLCVPAHAQQASPLPPAKTCFTGSVGQTGIIATLGSYTDGAAGTTGVYSAPLLGGTGSGAVATITVAGGVVTAQTLSNPGVGYTIGDTLTALPTAIGGVLGYSTTVTSTALSGALAGGSITFYTPGTTTPKSTWADAAQTTLNPNPVPLDGNGCAQLYGVGTYRQILKDNLGNVVWDQVVQPFNNQTLAYLSQGLEATTSAGINLYDNNSVQIANFKTGLETVIGDHVVASNGATPSTLYTLCGAPGIGASACNLVMESDAIDIAGYQNIYYGMVIDATTTRAGTTGENGLWINFNVNSGYANPANPGLLDRAGEQISAFCNAGGGQCWAAAFSVTFASGWAGTYGNFGINLELDPTNNATANTNPVSIVSPFSTIIGLWLAGAVGQYPLTDYIQVSPAGGAGYGSVYAAHVGMFFNGNYLTDDYTIWDHGNYGAGSGSNLASYNDDGNHTYGVNLNGAYGIAAINIGNVGLAIGIALHPAASICFNGNSQCMAYETANNAIVFNGPLAMLALGTPSAAATYACFTSDGHLISSATAC